MEVGNSILALKRTRYPCQIKDETGLMLDCECDFAVRLAETVLDREIQKNIRLLSLDGEAS